MDLFPQFVRSLVIGIAVTDLFRRIYIWAADAVVASDILLRVVPPLVSASCNTSANLLLDLCEKRYNTTFLQVRFRQQSLKAFNFRMWPIFTLN